jgi:Uma2 family endonuclease
MKICMVFQEGIELLIRDRIRRGLDWVIIAEKEDYKINPTSFLLLEIISKKTKKLHKRRLEYLRLTSLHYYLMIHQDEPIVEIYSRSGKSWQFDFYTELSDVVSLPFFETQLSLKDIFEGVSFEKRAE